jgi:precorrin-6B methylase 2
MPKRLPRPWFSEEYATAINARTQALNKLTANINVTNLSNFRIAQGRARRTIKLSKRTSWQNFVSQLSAQTSCKKVWNIIQKISGKHLHLLLHICPITALQ